MSRFHINSKGEPGQCRAEQGNCPFGGEHQHYDSAAKAQVAFELSMASSTLQSVSKQTASPAKAAGAVVRTSRPYPEKGDRVVISPHIAAHDADQAKYAGQEGTVEVFGGTHYSVNFDDGSTAHLIHYSLVKFAPEVPDYDDAPLTRAEREERNGVNSRGVNSTTGLLDTATVDAGGTHWPSAEAHKQQVAWMDLEQLREAAINIQDADELPEEVKQARLDVIAEAQNTYYPRFYKGFDLKDLSFDPDAYRDELLALDNWKNAAPSKIERQVEARRRAWEAAERTAPAQNYEKNVPIRLLPVGAEVHNQYKALQGRDPYTRVGTPVDNGPTYNPETGKYDGPHDIVGKYKDSADQWDYVSGSTTFDVGRVLEGKPLSPRWRAANERAAELAHQRERFRHASRR